MKKNLKVTRIFASSLLLAFTFLMSCSKDDGPAPIPEQESLILTSSNSVISDGETVLFTVKVNNSPIENATIYIEGHAITDYEHTFIEPGSYTVIAKKEGYKDSETLTITVNEVLVDVYVAGYEHVNGKKTATYWKNGVAHHLTSGTNSAEAKKIIIHNNDVYILVVEDYKTIKYWKNDQENHVYTEASGYTSARDMVITENGDVYIAGSSREAGVQTAKYWKNGLVTNLPHNNFSYATGIAVNGNDVYVSGYSMDANTHNAMRTALYWKNGVVVELSDGSVGTTATKIAISGNDVHVVGSVADGTAQQWNAKYWKNEEEINLLNGQEAKDIFIEGENIYILGSGGGFKYWRNGVLNNLPDGSFVNGITVFNNHVYTAGGIWNSETDVNTVGYWKNNDFTMLSEGTLYPEAYSIAVVAR